MMLLPAGGAAQTVVPTFDVERIGVEQGLSHRMVFDILEDRQGYMWFATRDGLDRYDGHRFVVYRHIPGDSLSLPDSKIETVFEASDGILWIGTSGGLVRFDRPTETFRRIPYGNESLPRPLLERIADIAETPDGTLWILTAKLRLFKLPPNGMELELVRVTVAGNSGIIIRGGTIGVGPNGGLFLPCVSDGGSVPFFGQLDPITGECMSRNRLPSTGQLGGMGFESDGSVILSTAVYTENGNQGVRVERWDDTLTWSVTFKASMARDQLVDNHAQIWLATYSGVFLIDQNGRLITHFTRNAEDVKTLSNDRTNAIARSRDGSVWIGTDDGITVFIPAENQFRAIRHRPDDATSLGDPRVNAILETSDGSLWVGTSKGLYMRPSDTDNFESIRLPDHPGAIPGSQTRIWSLIEAAPGIIWFGTAMGGLYELDVVSRDVRHRLEPLHLIADLNGHSRETTDGTSIPYIGRDRMGSLWMTSRRYFFRIDSLDTFTLITPGSGVFSVDRVVNLMHQDRRGSYWAGNDHGLWAMDPQSGEMQLVGENESKDRGLSYPSVWSMAESPLTPDALWVGTIGGGLNRYDVSTGRFTWYTMADGMPSNGVYGILVDDKGLLWMSTTNGLARFNPLTGSVEPFTRHDGLHADDFDLLAYHKGKVSGKMWFGGPTGLTEFHPDSVALSTSDFRVNISNISVLDRHYPGIAADGDTLRLTHTQNSLGFRFSAPDLLHPNDASYRYRLAGYDDDWRLNDATSPEVSYTQLPPGWYTLEVQAAVVGSGISKFTTRLIVWIVPAFWQTGWFKFLCLILALGTFGWGVSSIQRRRGQRTIELARREVELKRLLAEREQQERGRLAREIHDGPIQTLFSVNHRLEEASPDGLAASRRDVRALASELRAICEHLRPTLVANIGLEAALRVRVLRLTRRHPELTVTLSLDPECSSLADTTGYACYRIVQEALNNVVKHADASRADIRLVRDGSVCHLVISDDGKGCDLPADWLDLARDSHFGLVGMRERAEMLGGSCHIDSAPGKGTRIEVDLPMPSPQTAV